MLSNNDLRLTKSCNSLLHSFFLLFSRDAFLVIIYSYDWTNILGLFRSFYGSELPGQVFILLLELVWCCDEPILFFIHLLNFYMMIIFLHLFGLCWFDFFLHENLSMWSSMFNLLIDMLLSLFMSWFVILFSHHGCFWG